jgi:hypothetical protein
MRITELQNISVLVLIILFLTLFTAIDGFPQDVELPPDVIIWIEDMKNATPYEALPKPPQGCGAIRVESTKEIFIVIQREGSVRAWATIPVAYTKYGRKITLIYTTERE